MFSWCVALSTKGRAFATSSSLRRSVRRKLARVLERSVLPIPCFGIPSGDSVIPAQNCLRLSRLNSAFRCPLSVLRRLTTRLRRKSLNAEALADSRSEHCGCSTEREDVVFFDLPSGIFPCAPVNRSRVGGGWFNTNSANVSHQLLSHDNNGFDRSLATIKRGGGKFGWKAFTGSGVF
jgi:hypothetical protein